MQLPKLGNGLAGKRWVPIAMTAFAGLVVGGLIGGAIGTANGDLRVHDAKAAAAAHELHALSVLRTDMQEQVQAEKDRATQTIKDHDAKLKAQQDAVAAQKAQNDQLAAQLQAQQAAINANSFGDGLYQVGKDIQPGRYHTDGGDTCYYAVLHSSDTSDIASNNLGGGPQTVDINGPFFESKDCGTWTKVG